MAATSAAPLDLARRPVSPNVQLAWLSLAMFFFSRWCGAWPWSPTRRSSPRWSRSTSPRDHVGTALTVHTCAGFLLTMASIRLLPIAAQTVGRQWVFLCLVPGPVFGVLGLGGLSRPA